MSGHNRFFITQGLPKLVDQLAESPLNFVTLRFTMGMIN